MIRLFHVYFPTRTVLLALSEGLLIMSALLAATFAWFGRDSDFLLSYGPDFFKLVVVSVVCLLCMYYYDLYDSSMFRRPRLVLERLISVLGASCLILGLLYYAFPLVQLGDGPIWIWVVLTAASLVVWRKLFLILNRSSRFGQRTVLLGDGPLVPSLTAELAKRRELGLQLLGYVQGGSGSTDTWNGLARMGGIDELPALIRRERISRVVLSMGERRGRLPVELLLDLKTRGVVIEDAAELYEAITGKVPLQSLRPSSLLFSRGFCVSRAMLFYKRAASIVFSGLGLLLSLPAMLLAAVAIWLDSPGPVIFRQKRVGKRGELFTLYKFRSMRHDPDADGTARPAQEKDSRITRVGRWLRRTRLDELPQLYNILRGDMYLVGPRPFIPAEESEWSPQIPFYSQRWAVKPGATGWAQIQRGYCSSLEDNAEKLSYDLFYIKNMSVGLDFLIVFHTIKILLLGRGAR